MRYVVLVVSFASFICLSTYAQSGDIIIESDLQEEILRESGGYQEVVEVPSQPTLTRKVLILNRSNVVQQQPITNVEATPLTDSRAAQLRRSREDAEIATEQKIVEKLEQSRLEDEKARVLRLFGDKIETPQQSTPTELVPSSPQVQVISQEPVEQEASLEDVKNEIIHSVREELRAEEAIKEESKNESYVSAFVGMATYQDAINVESNEALGFSMGTRLQDKYIVEGSFIYSNHYVDQIGRNYTNTFVYDDLDQYNFIAAIKYAPKFGRISPQVGALISYTHRQYNEVNDSSRFLNQSSYISEESETDAFDMGFSLGMDIDLGENFVIGAEYRYFTNLTSKSQSRFLNDYYSSNNTGTPLEEFDYYSFAIVGKILF